RLDVDLGVGRAEDVLAEEVGHGAEHAPPDERADDGDDDGAEGVGQRADAGGESDKADDDGGFRERAGIAGDFPVGGEIELGDADRAVEYAVGGELLIHERSSQVRTGRASLPRLASGGDGAGAVAGLLSRILALAGR